MDICSETDKEASANYLTDELFDRDEQPEEGAETVNLPANKKPATLAN